MMLILWVPVSLLHDPARRRFVPWFINTSERKHYSEIKYETKVGRIMAYTLTQIRNKIVSHVNKQAAQIIEFKRAGLNNLVTYDVLQVRYA